MAEISGTPKAPELAVTAAARTVALGRLREDVRPALFAGGGVLRVRKKSLGASSAFASCSRRQEAPLAEERAGERCKEDV